MNEKELYWWDRFAQAGLIFFTLGGFLLTSLKLPQYGVLSALVSEIFWFYSTYKAWKEADQIGMFINTIATTVIIIIGVINYWFL